MLGPHHPVSSTVFQSAEFGVEVCKAQQQISEVQIRDRADSGRSGLHTSIAVIECRALKYGESLLQNN